MDLSLDNNTGSYKIRSYSPGSIMINDATYQDPIVVGLDVLRENVLPVDSSELNKELLEELKISDYEVVILGTGKNQQFPSWDLLEQAQMMGTPLEVMATDAACRTFTILASDGRKVLALLYP
ncbi:Mth938-like domain-containing protein [Kangiella koreensis]|nr:MTH938/NDUFAF3 family protein [Kangiella koreensis]